MTDDEAAEEVFRRTDLPRLIKRRMNDMSDYPPMNGCRLLGSPLFLLPVHLKYRLKFLTSIVEAVEPFPASSSAGLKLPEA